MMTSTSTASENQTQMVKLLSGTENPININGLSVAKNWTSSSSSWSYSVNSQQKFQKSEVRKSFVSDLRPKIESAPVKPTRERIGSISNSDVIIERSDNKEDKFETLIAIKADSESDSIFQSEGINATVDVENIPNLISDCDLSCDNADSNKAVMNNHDVYGPATTPFNISLSRCAVFLAQNDNFDAESPRFDTRSPGMNRSPFIFESKHMNDIKDNGLECVMDEVPDTGDKGDEASECLAKSDLNKSDEEESADKLSDDEQEDVKEINAEDDAKIDSKGTETYGKKYNIRQRLKPYSQTVWIKRRIPRSTKNVLPADSLDIPEEKEPEEESTIDEKKGGSSKQHVETLGKKRIRRFFTKDTYMRNLLFNKRYKLLTRFGVKLFPTAAGCSPDKQTNLEVDDLNSRPASPSSNSLNSTSKRSKINLALAKLYKRATQVLQRRNLLSLTSRSKKPRTTILSSSTSDDLLLSPQETAVNSVASAADAVSAAAAAAVAAVVSSSGSVGCTSSPLPLVVI